VIEASAYGRYPIILADRRIAILNSGINPAKPGTVSFASTNAAMVNVPLILELALNQGRRFGSPLRAGAKTMAASRMGDMNDVKAAFEAQLEWLIKRLIGDLQTLERANRVYHPTPFTSMLHEGCMTSGRCTTAGGAVYNFSGIQAVAPSAVGDALYAIDRVIFKDRQLTLPELRMLKTYFKKGGMQAQLNVIDPEELKNARDNPDLYPNLVVRVSGYTVYFRDLAPAVQDEIIQRSTLAA